MSVEEKLDELLAKAARQALEARCAAMDFMVKRALAEGRPHVYVWMRKGAGAIESVVSFDFPEDIDEVQGTIERIDVVT